MKTNRGHEYSLLITKIRTKDGNWTTPKLARNDFGYYHDPDSRSYWGPAYPVIKPWGEIYTESEIDQSSCTPILTIKLMKKEQLSDFNFDIKTYGYVGNEFNGLSKYCACEGKRTCQTTEEQKQASALLGKQYGLKTETSEMSVEKGFMIIIGSVAGGVVFLVVMAILLMKLKKQRRFRGP